MTNPDATVLELDEEQADWLANHLEGFIASKPVNTEPTAHAIVTKLHAAAAQRPA
jgi:hypothetical protein